MRRVAIAFYGIPRAAHICMPCLEEKIIHPLSTAYDVKCFYHLYKLQKIDNPRSGDKGQFPVEWYDYFSNFDGLLEDPELCLDRWGFDQIKNFGDIWGDEFKSIKNLIHQLNSLREVAQLLESFNPDCVIFLRPDLMYHDSIPNRIVQEACLSLDEEVWIPAWQWFGGLNDRFAVCSRRAYKRYAYRVEESDAYVREKGPLHAESLLSYQMNKFSVKINPMFVRASRVRADGTVRRENFSYRTWMDAENTSYPLLAKLFFMQVISKLRY